MIDAKIIDIEVQDIRFPTSLQHHGSDAMHTDPDYSCAYVTIKTDTEYEGYGLTFTLGRGTEIVVLACKSLFKIVKNHTTKEIYTNFASFWRKLTCDTQLRWIGPEKGVIHLATAAIVNALWDLWARIESKPVWKLLTDMSPEQLVSTIDFRYIDIVTEQEAIEMLERNAVHKKIKELMLRENGFPAYTTQVGWLGYSDQQVEDLCKSFLDRGFKAFKIKVGQNLDDDIRRCEMIRKVIGYENKLMLDANQVWEVGQAIEWMKKLAKYKPFWIEEPTSPDDIFGHSQIKDALNNYNIGIASGEMCANRVMFKQFLMFGLNFCQIDAARIGGINEILAVYFMAKKLKVPVCPHAGGVGLCEMVQHLQMWDYICLSQTTENRMIEYVDQQHEHFENPVHIRNAYYMPPLSSGYSTKFKNECIMEYAYPKGNYWKSHETK
ncbi:mitochondrial enolase superfamily member 1-like isoform X2 [Formica exsecta]|uniref:mitochondrial enolase superfamily member 1-like isoform X2 n=1 Tax=Formica exsecta TaxID=72781 RepID=UPI001141146B|nr:mitochondrial enolase superfamily member 1-like isoform X2 [Formica exsecta]